MNALAFQSRDSFIPVFFPYPFRSFSNCPYEKVVKPSLYVFITQIYNKIEREKNGLGLKLEKFYKRRNA